MAKLDAKLMHNYEPTSNFYSIQKLAITMPTLHIRLVALREHVKDIVRLT